MSWSQLCHSNGGSINYYLILAALFIAIFIFNLTNQIILEKSITSRLQFTVPFILASILFLTKYRGIIDIGMDVIFFAILALISPMGDFSAVPFIFLVLFRFGNSKFNIAILFILSLSLCFGFIINEWSLQNTFALIALYGFMGFKYYYIIHKPHQELKALLQFKNTVIDNLQNRLSVMGPRRKLTDPEIIDKYRFLKYSRTDANGNDDPYRKLRIIRMLSDGYEYKEICSELMIKDLNTLARTLKTIRRELSDRIDWTINNNTQLVKECIKLGIIHVDITP